MINFFSSGLSNRSSRRQAAAEGRTGSSNAINAVNVQERYISFIDSSVSEADKSVEIK